MNPATDSTLADPRQVIADLRRANAELQRELAEYKAQRDEALAREVATAEVLGVINASTGDLGPVFDAMLERATRLCGASSGLMWTTMGERFQAVAIRGMSTEFIEFIRDPKNQPRVVASNLPIGRVVRGEPLVHVLDLKAGEFTHEPPAVRKLLELGGFRTILALPLRNEAALLGAFVVGRREVRPFTDRQIALLQNFAAQAVIAMENARLLTETREALEQQTATAEVLQVINGSPGDLAPVFGTMLDKAMRLCEADFGSLWTLHGDRFRPAAHHGLPPRYAAYLAHDVPAAGPGTGRARLLAGEPFAHIADLAAEEPYRAGEPHRRALVDFGGARTAVLVPLRQDDKVGGFIMIYRQEVRPFTDKQIALLQNFAAQAVIAMENARLITETHEALDQQTATAEVLGVINSSPSDLTPVFNAILEKAHALCGVAQGSLQLYDGKTFRAVAVHNLPEPLVDQLRKGYVPSRKLPHWQVVEGAAFAQRDMAEVDDPFARKVTDSGIRTLLCVALRKDEMLLGQIVAARHEARLFSEREIALLQNFAAQAVIAMDNARLITETREALDQQTATAEVLGVINASPGDLAPVFNAMLEKAMHLCGAAFGELLINDGGNARLVAALGVPEAFAAFRQNSPARHSSTSIAARIFAGQSVVHTLDAKDEDLYRQGDAQRLALVDLGGARTTLAVGLLKDKEALGLIHIYRQEVRPFSEKQIALLQNFAAQAVIAMENARLLTETRAALAQQTATAEVLGVINASPGELTPVFDAVLQKATSLCEAVFGVLLRYDGQRFRAVALQNVPPELAEFLRQPVPTDPGTVSGQLVAGAPFICISDIASDEYADNPTRRAMTEFGGARSGIAMSLRKDGVLQGAIWIYRQEARPFNDKQIALLESFAAQAVIAMENARLITETREALEQQTATAEVLGVINASPGNLTPVFDAILDKAHLLCGAAVGALFLYDGEKVRAAAVHGYPEDVAETLRSGVRVPPPLIAGARMVHRHDVREDADDGVGRLISQRGGVRTNLLIPLRKEGVFLGMISCNRQEVRPYSDKEIALIQSFAVQAVIAIENARLLDEIRQRQAELRVTFDNMGDGVVMFDAEHRLAAWNRNFQHLLDLPDAVLAERPSYTDYLRLLAERGEFGTENVEAELARRLRGTDQELRLERERPDGRVIEVRRNAVPDGGFVLIYSDITERKRSDAEIRAARDAAEAAYHDLQAAQANLVQAQKMAALGQLTAGIAHEIKNPLNFVNNFAALSSELLDELREEVAPALATLDGVEREGIDETIEMLTGNLDRIVEHGQRADNIVKSMLEHSRGVSGERREVDLNGLIEDALNLAYHGARAQNTSFNITIERDYTQALKPIELAPQEITRVFLNLFGNGFYAAHERATANGEAVYRPTLRVVTRESEDGIEVRVRDNGTGIAPEIKDKLFQPFFTTKPTGEGTGLGLSISYDIITQQHGGTITVESEPNSYTEFTIRLPRH